MEKLMPWEITLQLCDAAGTTPKPQESPPESSPASPKGNPRLHLVPLSKRAGIWQENERKAALFIILQAALWGEQVAQRCPQHLHPAVPAPPCHTHSSGALQVKEIRAHGSFKAVWWWNREKQGSLTLNSTWNRCWAALESHCCFLPSLERVPRAVGFTRRGLRAGGREGISGKHSHIPTFSHSHIPMECAGSSGAGPFPQVTAHSPVPWAAQEHPSNPAKQTAPRATCQLQLPPQTVLSSSCFSFWRLWKVY